MARARSGARPIHQLPIGPLGACQGGGVNPPWPRGKRQLSTRISCCKSRMRPRLPTLSRTYPQCDRAYDYDDELDLSHREEEEQTSRSRRPTRKIEKPHSALWITG